MIIEKNKELLFDFYDYITVDEVKRAFDILVGSACTQTHLKSYPQLKGVVRDFRFYADEKSQPFAFIINKTSLLFYLRLPAVKSARYELAKLRDIFPEIKENNSGEWTIKIQDISDAQSIATNILGLWR